MEVCAPSESKPAAKRLWLAGLVGALIVGAVLRLVWVNDIEFKADEAWTFQQTRDVARSGPFPWLGMPCSAGFRNPGMSIWVFLLFGKVVGVAEPTNLARAVQILSIVAIVFLVIFAWRWVGVDEREPWLWAAALVSVNPVAVVFHRKIWPPSVLPIFSLAMLAGWWRRERWWGAFAWGLVGCCLGQIHMAGFFFAAGFAAWALLFDRRRVVWSGWLSGSLLGAVGMIPWLGYLFTECHGQPNPGRWVHLLEFKFWVRWVKEPLGFGLDYVLGDNFDDFLRYPVINGRPSYLIWFFQTLLTTVAVILFVRAGWCLLREHRPLLSTAIGDSPSAFTQSAALWGFGVLLSASSFYIQRHYLVVTFPLEFVWLARLALAPTGRLARDLRPGRALLLTLCLGQFLLTAQFLRYIHGNQGAKDGDYGICYGARQHVTEQGNAAISMDSTGE
jgi:hypothetical protein